MRQDMTKRTFGVELEITNLSPNKCRRVLEQSGIRVDHDPIDYKYWSVTTDTSIDDWAPGANGCSCEVVSPILKGEKGLRQVQKVCAALKKAGARVNPSCGLHVHVGAKDLTVPELIAIINRYAHHENFIDRLVFPNRRRRGNCDYTSSLKPELLKDIKEMWRREREEKITNMTIDEFINYIGPNRYCHINLTSYKNHGTIEFRQHHGTIDGYKVVNWIQFLLNFIEQGRLVGNNKPSAQKTQLHLKYKKILKAFRNSKGLGLTRSQIARLGGWETTSVPQMMGKIAKIYNLDYITQGRRFYLTPQRRRFSKDPNVMTGLPNDVKNHFMTRAQAYRSRQWTQYA